MSDQKKTPSKKPNSYSLLLKGLSEVEKKNPTKSSASKNSKTSFKRSATPESTMSSQNNQENSSNDKSGECQDPDIPDRSYGDYYCKLCDSHMNSDNMWDAHITGKRHIKNVKKGDTESKYDDLPDVESSIKYELRNVKDPVVGLSYIHEIRRKEPNVPPIYNCFLCHASIATVPLVTEHVISMKHRLNYIKENNPDEYELIEATNLKKGHMEPLVMEAARKMELELGRGTVKVKQEKKKSPVYTYSAKKTFNLDDSGDDDNDDKYKSWKTPRFDDNNYSSSLWKSVDTGRNLDPWQTTRSSRDFEDAGRSFGQWEKNRTVRDIGDTGRNFGQYDRSPRDFEDTGKSFGQYEKSRTHRDFEDNYRKRSRSRSPRERKRVSYSDEERSMDSYKKSYSKRNISPLHDSYDKHKSFSKREISPKRDYHQSIDNFLQSSRKNDSLDRSNYITPQYEHTSNAGYNMQSANKRFNTLESAISFLSKENLLPPLEKPVVKQPKSMDEILQDTLLLSSEDCYILFTKRIQLLPVISNVSEVCAALKLISETQKKLRGHLVEQIMTALSDKLHKVDNSTDIIPGLGDSTSSATESANIIANNSNKAMDAENFISNIFKSINYSPVNKMPTSFAPSISSLPTGPMNTYQQPPPANYQAPPTNYQAPPTNYQAPPANYQAPPTNYQAPPANYQAPPMNSFPGASTSSYPNQIAYQQQNTNMQYATSQASNYTSNIPPGSGDRAIPQASAYKYLHNSSPSMSSPASKNYPRKY